MKKNNLLLIAALSCASSIIPSQAPKPGFSLSMPTGALNTSHTLNIDHKSLKELIDAFTTGLQKSFSSIQFNLDPKSAGSQSPIRTSFELIHDSKALGEALGNALSKTNVGIGIDYEKLEKALAALQVNLDTKALKELAGSKEVQDAIANLKLIPANLTINPVHFRLEQIPHVPVDLTLNLSAQDGRRMAGAAGATMATAAILFCGAGATGYAFLAGSCAALYPEQAQQACRMVFNERNYQATKACCFATGAAAATSLNQCLSKCKKPGQLNAKRD